MPLLDGLQFCFRMNESSGNRIDSVAGLQLAPTGTIGSVAGKFGNAVDLADGSRLVGTASNSAYRGAGSFTLACWVNLDVINLGSSYPMIRWNGGGTARDYNLAISTTGIARCEITTTTSSVTASTNAGAITTGAWHLIVGWYDATVGTHGTAYVQVNNGTIYSTALTGPRENVDSTTLLSFGQGDYGFAPFGRTDGKIDQACKWSRVLTADERAELWNSGVGKAFPFVVDLGGEVGWWCPSLDGAGNGTANLVDLSESGNHGILTNMDPPTDWVSDTASGGVRALDFDGVNDFIPIGSSGSMVRSGAFSVSAWCRRSGGTGTQYICADYNASGTVSSFLLLARTGTGRFEFAWENPQNTYNGAVSTTTITNNVWYHVAATWDGTTRRIYVNGIEEGSNSTAQSQPLAGSVGTMAIGRPGSFNGLYWNGQIDDCRFFNRALTASEIAALASQRGYQRPSNTRRRRYAGAYGL